MERKKRIENPTFKDWFEYQWGNKYIQLFIVALGFLIGMLFELEGLNLIFCLIPIATMSVIGYMGFYKVWKDYVDGF